MLSVACGMFHVACCVLEFIEQCRDTSGTTAVCILIEHSTRRLWVANVGDSRAVLCRKGTVLALTRDHKADRPDEVERIRKAGGYTKHTHTDRQTERGNPKHLHHGITNNIHQYIMCSPSRWSMCHVQ